jgi:hypothetical protein
MVIRRLRSRGRVGICATGWPGAWDAILGTVMRMGGSARIRARTGTLVVCALAFAGGSVNGAAETAGPVPDLAPPFSFAYRTQTSSMVVPCQEIRNPPATRELSDPATGEIRAAMVAQAQDCKSLAHDVSEVWNLGAAPEALVGQPAHVTVMFVPGTFDPKAEGDAEMGGGVFLSIGGSQEWALGSFRCAGGTCTPAAPQPQDGRVVLEGTIDMLPAQVQGEYRTEAFVKRGTGRSSVSLSGRLESVTFGPAGADVPRDVPRDVPPEGGVAGP